MTLHVRLAASGGSNTNITSSSFLWSNFLLSINEQAQTSEEDLVHDLGSLICAWLMVCTCVMMISAWLMISTWLKTCYDSWSVYDLWWAVHDEIFAWFIIFIWLMITQDNLCMIYDLNMTFDNLYITYDDLYITYDDLCMTRFFYDLR